MVLTVWSPKQHELKVMKGPLLRRLYCTLSRISMDLSFHQYKCEDAFSIDIWNDFFPVKLRFEDMVCFSDLLFDELGRQFKHLLSNMGFLPVMMSSSQTDQHADHLAPSEDIILLLRCCTTILQLLEFDHSIVQENCKVILAILKELCSMELLSYLSCQKVHSAEEIICFKKSVSHDCEYTDDGSISSVKEELDAFIRFTKQAGSPVALLCTMLEVFADELLVHHHLRKYLARTELFSSTREKPFISEDDHEDIVLQVISAHFLLLVSDEHGINGFPNTLVWSCENSKVSHLSLSSAIAMLGSVVFRAPQVLQAHAISLISGCIGIKMVPNREKLDPCLLNDCMVAFELSVKMYARRILSLKLGSWVLEPCILDCISSLHFKTCIQPDIYDKVNSQICKLLDPCHPCFCSFSSKTKHGLQSASVDFIKENLAILGQSYRDEACSILYCIIGMSLHGEMSLKESDCQEINWHEIYLLAAALKLMSCSLLQVVWFMRNYGIEGGLRTLKNFSMCQEYDLIISIISFFGQGSGAAHPIEKFLLEAMGMNPERHKYTMPMLAHFSYLLSFSFNAGPDFLWKNCIFMIMVLLNLLFFEDGNLDMLLSLFDCKERPTSSLASDCIESSLLPLYYEDSDSCFQLSTKISQGLVCQSSSYMVATNFKKIQSLYICNGRKCLSRATSREENLALSSVQAVDDPNKTSESGPYIGDAVESDGKAEADMCDGEIFLELLGVPSESTKELADFVVCKRNKDYSSWLRQREMFRKWKCGKVKAIKHARSRFSTVHTRNQLSTAHTLSRLRYKE